MIDFKLDPVTGDLDTSSLDIGLIDGAERVRQQLYIKLNLWRQEWFLDTAFGTPWLQEILGKEAVSVVAARAALRASALEVDGVDAVPVINFVYDGPLRKMTVRLEASTSYGIVKVEGVYGNSQS